MWLMLKIKTNKNEALWLNKMWITNNWSFVNVLIVDISPCTSTEDWDTSVLSWCWTYCWRYVGITLMNHYGPGKGQIWLDDVECIGYESSIAECSHNGWGSHNCRHHEDVSISCNTQDDDCKFSVRISLFARSINKKITRRWDSEHELSLRRHRTHTTKYNRLAHKFHHMSTQLCVETQVYQIQWNNTM